MVCYRCGVCLKRQDSQMSLQGQEITGSYGSQQVQCTTGKEIITISQLLRIKDGSFLLTSTMI